MRKKSVYDGCGFILPTKHAKSLAVAPPLWEKTGACVLEHALDTDALGTFSGEVERTGSALDCARRKCLWSLERLDGKAEFALSSEGSFGPHPLIPFIACDHEILYFVDRKHGFDLHVSQLSAHTNYRTEAVSSIEELHKLAAEARFPSHALILRPDGRDSCTLLFKGITDTDALESAFKECMTRAETGKVWMETDMRARFNPSRMSVIEELAHSLADRLVSHCPACDTPGWGRKRTEKGLRCKACGTETEMTKHEINGCVKCSYEETVPRGDGLLEADPGNCPWCNP